MIPARAAKKALNKLLICRQRTTQFTGNEDYFFDFLFAAQRIDRIGCGGIYNLIVCSHYS